MVIGEKIFNLRKSKNMSQEELANVLNVSRQTISKWETGESNPDFDKIVPLCEFFGITTDELLRGNNPILEEKIVRVNKKNKALVFSLCIMIFVVMCILSIIFDNYNVSDWIMGVTCITCIGAIAIILVNYFLSKSDEEIKLKPSYKSSKITLINFIVRLVALIIYFVTSFIWGFEFTWIILFVMAIINRIIKLIFLMKENQNAK